MTNLNRVALAGLVVLYFATRLGVLASSWDVNQNWEEPVFLYSALELKETGVASVFDHQDDLNHGGSVLLLLAAVPWFYAAPASLAGLKCLMVVWFGLTLVVFLWLVARYLSPLAAVFFGVLYVFFSPTLTRMNLTAVGSHPEALLPCGLALAASFASERRVRSGVATETTDLALGVCSGLALWCSYVSATFVAPLLAVSVGLRRSVWRYGLLATGLALGLAPWAYQNLYLRPHASLRWYMSIVKAKDLASLPVRAAGRAQELAASFGLPGSGGEALVLSAALVILVIGFALVRKAWRARIPQSLWVVAPIVLMPCFGFVLLAAADLPRFENGGYYSYRFFIPLQISIFLLFALVTDLAARLGMRWLVAAALTLVFAAGAWLQMPLYGQGNNYKPDPEAERLRGCFVFGVAEGERAPDSIAASQRLLAVRDRPCREHAFGGLGWWLAGRFREHAEISEIDSVLRSIDDLELRRAACNGLAFVLSGDDISPAQRSLAHRMVGPICAQARPFTKTR